MVVLAIVLTGFTNLRPLACQISTQFALSQSSQLLVRQMLNDVSSVPYAWYPPRFPVRVPQRFPKNSFNRFVVGVALSKAHNL